MADRNAKKRRPLPLPGWLMVISAAIALGGAVAISLGIVLDHLFGAWAIVLAVAAGVFFGRIVGSIAYDVVQWLVRVIERAHRTRAAAEELAARFAKRRRT